MYRTVPAELVITFSPEIQVLPDTAAVRPQFLIEKILRVQPNVKKLYLLIRARDSISAKERFNNEVIKTDLFGVLREKLGANLHALIEDRVFPVAGDIACDNLGINSELKDEMCREIDIFVNSAAATRFDERYDTAIRINTLGALNILKFSKQCSNVNMLLHISTAYVCGVKEGLIQEKPLHYGETLNRGSHLEIDAEHKLVEEKLKDLQARNATEKEVTLAMRVLGIERFISPFTRTMIVQGKDAWMAKHIHLHKSNGRDAFRILKGGPPTHNPKANSYIKHC
uniref:Fatty acyl-CoA reductase n=1 Tax=Nicotiana tabacum TaxID=4097 RepID=A0A1S4C0P0_TOBAC|nr:PREDICTED: fatty acyl-CoA reductase 3-like [Nicotiana tabacum]